MYYCIFNKILHKKLTHPAVGLWYTPRKEEAEEMLVSLNEYLIAINKPDLKENFCIIEFESEEEVSQL